VRVFLNETNTQIANNFYYLSTFNVSRAIVLVQHVTIYTISTVSRYIAAVYSYGVKLILLREFANNNNYLKGK